MLPVISCSSPNQIEAHVGHAYSIEFDILLGHQSGTGATLGNEVLAPTPWRSIGDPAGGRFANETGGPIRAIHLATNNPGDIFDVSAASAGRLFDTIWLKDDGTEAHFLDGHVPNSSTIPNLSAFWLRVPPNPDTEIQQCDSGGSCPFTGQAFAANPSDPVGPAWKKIKSSRRTATEKWRRLYAACPSMFRDFTTYAESPDGRLVLFVCNGEMLRFDDNTATVARYSPQETIFSVVNRISLDNSVFTLWRSGNVVRNIHVDAPEFTPVGHVPAPKG